MSLAFPRVAAVLALAAAAPVGAQVLENAAVIAAPHFTQYTLGSGAGERTITQMATPFILMMPVGDRFSVDLTTAFSTSEVKSGASTSRISGLTDTQIRGNYSFGEMMVFTLGINIPTGQYTVAEEDSEAAGQIGNDFLNFPISSMGNGFAGTGGFAFARPMGSWNVGFGASMRKSTQFSAYALTGAEFRFTPADEYRLSVGIDRPVGDGEVTLGAAFSAYGADQADTTAAGSGGTAVSTGDRVTLNGSWMVPVGPGDLYLSGWNLFRMEGERFGGDAPGENIANLNASYSLEMGPVLVQPSLEGRFWQVDGERAGQLTNLNVRLRMTGGAFTFFPALGYSLGNLYAPGSGTSIDVTGFRGSLTVRFN